jgi:hypothetical protein
MSARSGFFPFAGLSNPVSSTAAAKLTGADLDEDRLLDAIAAPKQS